MILLRKGPSYVLEDVQALLGRRMAHPCLECGVVDSGSFYNQRAEGGDVFLIDRFKNVYTESSSPRISFLLTPWICPLSYRHVPSQVLKGQRSRWWGISQAAKRSAVLHV